MEVRIGDAVRFISEKMEGVVTGIVNAHTVNVYCEAYGFDIPAAVNDLVVIRSSFKNEERPAKETTTVAATQRLYLAFVPEKFNALPESRHELYLVNDTSLAVLFAVSLRGEQGDTGVAAGSCNPLSVAPVGNYALKELDAIKALRVQALFHQTGEHPPRPVVDVTVKVNAVTLCKSGAYRQAPRIGQMAWLRPLDESPEELDIDPRQLLQAKREKREERSEPPAHPQTADNVVEIDLHAESLLDTLAGMESKDILEYQLNVFHETLETYKLRRGQKIVFIHGKGDGVLKQRIRWELQTKYKRCNHQDASFKQYGYGATLVTIR
ncbi:MAG: DUF2027 domain-containing protein [Odoribacteraceae bacterium]|jgi:hypothetical protein|nr:DUF2027 domain-containing protein [Odoribacteraceae bacterium]